MATKADERREELRGKLIDQKIREVETSLEAAKATQANDDRIARIAAAGAVVTCASVSAVIPPPSASGP